jgi:Raf kinase inhibitor-like YbhB/YbcL family protein
MILTSTEFQNYGPIPQRFTCEGVPEDRPHISPPLAWSELPANTRSLVLIVEDEDATDENFIPLDDPWVHWVLCNIPPSGSPLPGGGVGLPEGVGLPGRAPLPAGTLEGVDDRGRTGYRGPCPPRGRHHYFHTLLALNKVLSFQNPPSKDAILERFGTMFNRPVGEGPLLELARYQLVGTYDGPPPPP